MAPKGGEEPPAKGRRFDDAIYHLLDKTGYRIIKRHSFGKDIVAEPPIPKSTLFPLMFSPRNRTVFEAKGGKAPSVKSYAKELRRKIRLEQTKDRNHVYSGVVITEDHIPDGTKKFTMEKYAVAIWDIKTILFIASKIERTRQLTRIERMTGLKNEPIEVQIDLSTTGQYVTRSYNQATNFICSIYYQHPFEQLDSERFGAILRIFTGILNRTARRLTNKTYASVDVFSLPGFTDDLTSESVVKVLNENSAEKIIYDAVDVKLLRFDTAAWSLLTTPLPN